MGENGPNNNGYETKKEMLQLYPETGITEDVFLEFHVLSLPDHAPDGIDTKEWIREMTTEYYYPFKHYNERYPQDVYQNSLNDKGREIVKRLDEIIDWMNDHLKDPSSYEIDQVVELNNEIKRFFNR